VLLPFVTAVVAVFSVTRLPLRSRILPLFVTVIPLFVTLVAFRVVTVVLFVYHVPACCSFYTRLPAAVCCFACIVPSLPRCSVYVAVLLTPLRGGAVVL